MKSLIGLELGPGDAASCEIRLKVHQHRIEAVAAVTEVPLVGVRIRTRELLDAREGG